MPFFIFCPKRVALIIRYIVHFFFLFITGWQHVSGSPGYHNVVPRTHQALFQLYSITMTIILLMLLQINSLSSRAAIHRCISDTYATCMLILLFNSKNIPPIHPAKKCSAILYQQYQLYYSLLPSFLAIWFFEIIAQPFVGLRVSTST